MCTLKQSNKWQFFNFFLLTKSMDFCPFRCISRDELVKRCFGRFFFLSHHDILVSKCKSQRFEENEGFEGSYNRVEVHVITNL